MLYKIYQRERKSKVPVYRVEELLTGVRVKGIFYTNELVPVSINENIIKTFPKINYIYDKREEDNEIYVLVSFEKSPKQKEWVKYRNLIQY